MKKRLGIVIVSVLCVTIFLAVGLLIINKYRFSASGSETMAGTVINADETEDVASGAEKAVNMVVKTEGTENGTISMEEVAAVVDETEDADETEGSEEETDEASLEEEEKVPVRVVDDAEVEAYLADSVIIGDSIVLGYRNFCRKSEDETLKSIQFLAAGSFSAHNAMWPVSDKSVHPLYQGEQRPVWESVAMMGAKNVFICFGINDLNIDDNTCEYYKQVIDNILASSPEVGIHIISMTYTLKDQGKGKLNNDVIREYNLELAKMAGENGWGYVDIAPLLADEEGNLAPEYCSDGFLHQNPAAYEIWTQELRRYVKEWLGFTDAPYHEE